MKYESFIYYFRIILIESINDNKELGITYMLKPNFIKIQNFINIILKKKELSYEKSKSLITQFQVLNNINPDETEENQKTLIIYLVAIMDFPRLILNDDLVLILEQ